MKTPPLEPIEVFEKLSIILTGFSKADIIGTGMLQTYFDTIHTELEEGLFFELLFEVQKITVTNPEQPSTDELQNISELVSHSKYETAISQIIQLWYLGEWVFSPTSDQNYIISSQSYLEGLIWKSIAAHPMGGKQPGFGTWGFAPLTFSSDSTNKLT